MTASATTSEARTANGFDDPAIDTNMDDWVLGVYAPALRIIEECFVLATGHSTDHGAKFAGVVLAHLAHHEPPIGVDIIR